MTGLEAGLTRQDRIARELKRFLPGFAFPERAVRADGDRDFIGTFAGDDKSHLTVALEFSSDIPDSPCLVVTRSGGCESCFSLPELEKVHSVLGALLLARRSCTGNL